MKPAGLRALVEAMPEAPWAVHGRPGDRFIESARRRAEGAYTRSWEALFRCVAEGMADDDAAGIVALRNHALPLLDLVNAARAIVEAGEVDEVYRRMDTLRQALARIEAVP